MGVIKFTADRKAEVLRARRLGASQQTCAAAGGISKETLRLWLERGRTSDGGNYADFAAEFDAAGAYPNVRALEIVQKAMLDKPELAWKFLQVKEPGFAPPATQLPARSGSAVVVNLSLGGRSAPTWMQNESEVIDATEVPAIGDGSSDTASAS